MHNLKIRLVLTELAAAVILAVFVLAVVKKPVKDDVPFNTLKEALLSAAYDPSNMKEAGALQLRTLYGLNADDYEEVLLYVPSSNMDAQELLLIRCKEKADTDSVAEAMRKRIEAERGVFESYGVEQMGLLDKAFVEVRGRLCLYVCDKNSDSMREAFLKALK